MDPSARAPLPKEAHTHRQRRPRLWYSCAHRFGNTGFKMRSLIEIKQLAFELQKEIRTLDEEKKEALKAQGFFKLHRKYVVKQCFDVIMAVNKHIALTEIKDDRKD